MKNTRGMTLIEVIVSIAIIGIIAVGFFGPLSSGYRYTVESQKFTVDSFKVQQQIEQQIDDTISRWDELSEDDRVEKEIFGKTVKGYIIDTEIKLEDGSSHGRYTAFVPNIEIVYEVPEIESVELKIDGAYTDSTPMVDGEGNVKSDMLFKGYKTDGDQTNFLMNVYRWYISPEMETPPTDTRDYLVLKEWNEARETVPYNKDDLSAIPNIKDNYNQFSFKEIADQGFTDEELIERFAGRHIIYSVTPYSQVGRIGEEVFSNSIYIEPVE